MQSYSGSFWSTILHWEVGHQGEHVVYTGKATVDGQTKTFAQYVDPKVPDGQYTGRIVDPLHPIEPSTEYARKNHVSATNRAKMKTVEQTKSIVFA
jgi:hypothetical protein